MNVSGSLKIASKLTLNENAGTSGQVLTSNGSGNTPTWQTLSSGSGIIISIATGQPFTVSSGALSLNVSSPLQISDNSLGINTAASPTFAGLTINGIINSNASGSAPVAHSNAGMILDCYTPNHTDGLGIQAGGIWLKYDYQFDIYRDNGTTIIDSLHLDNSGNLAILGDVTIGDPIGSGNTGLFIPTSGKFFNTQTLPVTLELPSFAYMGTGMPIAQRGMAILSLKTYLFVHLLLKLINTLW